MTSLLPVITRNALFGRPDLNALDRLLGGWSEEALPAANRWAPELDVHETPDAYVMEVEAAGVAKEDIDITLTDGLLIIQGEKKQPAREDGGVHIRERRYGSFARTLRIPGLIDAGKVSASTRDGVLTISIPKAEEEKPRKIEVRS